MANQFYNITGSKSTYGYGQDTSAKYKNQMAGLRSDQFDQGRLKVPPRTIQREVDPRWKPKKDFQRNHKLTDGWYGRLASSGGLLPVTPGMFDRDRLEIPSKYKRYEVPMDRNTREKQFKIFHDLEAGITYDTEDHNPKRLIIAVETFLNNRGYPPKFKNDFLTKLRNHRIKKLSPTQTAIYNEVMKTFIRPPPPVPAPAPPVPAPVLAPVPAPVPQLEEKKEAVLEANIGPEVFNRKYAGQKERKELVSNLWSKYLKAHPENEDNLSAERFLRNHKGILIDTAYAITRIRNPKWKRYLSTSDLHLRKVEEEKKRPGPRRRKKKTK